MEHDFEKQKEETYWVWSDIQARNKAIPDRVNLDLHFLPIHNDKRSQTLKHELQELGYTVSFYEDGDTLQATIEAIENSANEFWLHEKRATEVALMHGYKPDGWGYMTN